MSDVLGKAIWDYYDTDKESILWVHDVIGPKVEMPISIYFRDYDEMPELEQIALMQCYGNILDIGAGAGSHAIALEMRGFYVDALDISPLAVKTMQHRGADHVICSDIFSYSGKQYDTLLMLMNGIGFCGTISNLKLFLEHAKQLLTDEGQLIFDSSDVAYLYEDGLPKPDHYYGEIKCCYEYESEKSAWFHWLYIDENLLRMIANQAGYKMQKLYEDESGQFLVKLTLK